MRFFARWPILDQDTRVTDLHEEATDDLAAMLEDRGLIAFGDIVYTLETVETLEGEDALELHAVVDVVPFRKDAA